jgi:hypothetical protein
MTVATQLLDAVENAEPVILHFVDSRAGDRTLYADVLVPANYVTDENGGHRIPDTEVTRYNVMDRRGDWRSVPVADIARVECI